jgi:hypothetical protein
VTLKIYKGQVEAGVKRLPEKLLHG